MADEDFDDDELDDDDDDDDESADEQAGALQGGAMTPADAASKMEELIATPGYVTGQLQFDNPAAYRRIVKDVAALSAIAARGNAEKDVEAVRDFEAARSQKKDDLREAAEQEMSKLVELGFEEAEIPDDVGDVDLRALKEQRLYGEGGYAELGTMLEDDLTSLERSGGMPPGKINAIRELIRTEGVDPALKSKVDDIANDIIALIYAAKKRSKK